MTFLRWAAVLPVSFIAGVASAIIAMSISQGSTFVKVITGLLSGAIFVLAGAFVAPSHRLATAIALAIINCLYSLSQARALSLAPGERIDWLSIARAVGGILPACAM